MAAKYGPLRIQLGPSFYDRTLDIPVCHPYHALGIQNANGYSRSHQGLTLYPSDPSMVELFCQREGDHSYDGTYDDTCSGCYEG
jgi:hypothetical protein